jgi:hypothetical protein
MLRGNLTMQQTDCMGRRPADGHAGAAGPKRGTKPRARRATTRFHHAARRRGGQPAASSGRAAVSDAGDQASLLCLSRHKHRSAN